MIDDDLRAKLQSWAATKPTIKALYVFGSYARGYGVGKSTISRLAA
jgi:predicted nucleotidyltransferase